MKFVDNVELFCLCNKTRANCLHFLFSSLYFENVENFESVCGRVCESVCVLMNKHVCTYLLYVGVLMTICMLSTYVLWSATELLLYLLLLSRFTFAQAARAAGLYVILAKRPKLITATVLHQHLAKHLNRTS